MPKFVGVPSALTNAYPKSVFVLGASEFVQNPKKTACIYSLIPITY
jgi:hypothetical protein